MTASGLCIERAMYDGAQFTGWGLREAVRRTVDPDTLTECISAERARRTTGARRRIARHNVELDGAAAESDNVANNGKSAAQNVKNELKNHLKEARLIAWGRRGSPTTEPTSIPSSLWNALHFEDFRQSAISEMTKASTQIVDVRIYPVLESPDAIGHVDGKTLVETFRKFVFGDPQVVRLRKRALAAGGQPDNLQRHRPVWRVDYGKIAEWSSPVGYLNRFEQKYIRTCSANYVLGQRFARLIGYLVAGTLVADGVTRDGRTVEIRRSFWERERVRLDLINGDLLEFLPDAQDLDEAYSRSIYRGLMFRRRGGMFHVEHTASVALRSSTTESPTNRSVTRCTALSASIGQAIAAIWPNGIPGALPVQQRDQRIIAWQKEKCLAVASAKSIYRYLKQRRQPPTA
jgi:hypothetical protein